MLAREVNRKTQRLVNRYTEQAMQLSIQVENKKQIDGIQVKIGDQY